MYIFTSNTIEHNLFTELKYKLNVPKTNCLFAHAVIDNKVDGVVIVDDTNQPKSIYIRHPYGMSLFIGDTNNKQFKHELFCYLSNHFCNHVEYLQVVSNFNSTIYNHAGISTNVYERVNFKFNIIKYKNNYSYYLNNYSLFKANITHYNQIIGEVVPSKFWRNGDEFNRLSVAYIIKDNDAVVSVAFAAFIHENYLEIGIETHPNYRNKNLAYLCCLALIDYCIENKLEPLWACRKDNIGSLHLALKLGFEPTITIPYYQLKHNRSYGKN